MLEFRNCSMGVSRLREAEDISPPAHTGPKLGLATLQFVEQARWLA